MKYDPLSVGKEFCKVIALEKDARDFGFEWPDTKMILTQVKSECDEILEALEHQEGDARVQEEVSDLLHGVLSLCVFLEYDVEEILKIIREKFGKRMEALREITKEQGLSTLKGQDISFMLDLWKEAKKRSNTSLL